MLPRSKKRQSYFGSSKLFQNVGALPAALAARSQRQVWYLVLVALLVCLLWQQYSTMIDLLTDWSTSAAAAAAAAAGIVGHQNNPNDYDPFRLIFIISMGQEAMQSTLVERFVWSARHRGMWSGWIFLMTDAPIDRYRDSGDERFLVVNPQPQHLNTTFRQDMPYKRFKTRVIEYLEMDPRLSHVQLVYYLDVDNIVGNSLPTFMTELEHKYNIPGPDQKSPWIRLRPPPPTIWFFENKYAHLSVQGGQFIVNRDISQPCLTHWRELIDANVTEPKDQPALHKIRTQSDSGDHSNCRLVSMKPEKYLYFPSNASVHREAAKIARGRKITYPYLVHIKNSCNTTAQIDEIVEEVYIGDIVQNPALSKKIHVQPDDNNQSGGR